MILKFQVKAQKKQTEAKKQHMERDSNKLTTTSTMQSSRTQPKTDVTSKTPTTKASSAMRETSQQVSKHQSTSDQKREPAHGKSRISLPLLVNTQDSHESTEPSLRNITPADSNVLRSQSTGKPLREKQLLPLPHLGDLGEIIPPPVEFSEPPESSNRKAEELQQPTENAKLDEKKASETTHLSGLFEPTSVNHSVKDPNLDDCSVIVEVHSLGDPNSLGDLRHRHDKPEDTRDNAIGQDTRRSQPMTDRNYGGKRHVTTGGRHKKSDQSASEEFTSLLPSWKRQIFVNRMIKEKALEKAEREKREIEQRKWVGVPLWKIPLLTKKEEERLKEEQRWLGMPEWKKNLLRRRGTERIYRDYHGINSGYPIRRSVSFHLADTASDEETDVVTRPRGISSPE